CDALHSATVLLIAKPNHNAGSSRPASPRGALSMLQWLFSAFADHHIAFNLVRYITFRAAAAMATSLLLSLWLGPRVIAWLRQLRLGQVVRMDGPNTHLGKAGTPTMGGLLIVGATAASALLWGDIGSRFNVTAVCALLATGAIGFMDDYLKVVRR